MKIKLSKEGMGTREDTRSKYERSHEIMSLFSLLSMGGESLLTPIKPGLKHVAHPSLTLDFECGHMT